MVVYDRYNAFSQYVSVETDREGFKGPLSGLSLAIKDIFDVVGTKASWGLPDKLDESTEAKDTNSAIQNLTDAGAEIIGKTVCDELCFSTMGQNAFYPRVINPQAPDRYAGGSSTGSAAAVAGALTDIATATDTGGSVRAPAAFCGLIGLRTTHGLIPLDHCMPLAPSMDTFGWFTANSDIYAKIADVLLPSSHYQFDRLIHIRDLDALVLNDATDAYATIFEKVVRHLGAPKEVQLSTMTLSDRHQCFKEIESFEAWAQHGRWICKPGRKISTTIRDRFAFGQSVTPKSYASALKLRRQFREELEDVIGERGLLIMPTMPGPAPLINANSNPDDGYRVRAHKLLCHSSLSGLPEISVPLGKVNGAPFGVSLIGPWASDRALIDVARELLSECQ